MAPEPLTTAGGAILMAHGSDVAASGFNELWTGKPQETLTDKAVTQTAKVFGASDAIAHQIGDGVDMGISLGSAGVGLIQSARGAAVVADDVLVTVKIGKEPETQFGKLRLSYEYYKSLGWSKGRIKSHLDGIDFTKPVTLTNLPRASIVSQFQVPGGKTGNYFAKQNAKATELGINPKAEVGGVLVDKTKTMFKLSSNETVLESTAKSGIIDTWSVPKKPFQTKGGGTQYFARDNTVFIPKD